MYLSDVSKAAEVDVEQNAFKGLIDFEDAFGANMGTTHIMEDIVTGDTLGLLM